MITKESIIEDITMAYVFLYSVEYEIDTTTKYIEKFLHDIEKSLQVMSMKYVWKYWSSLERYIMNLC